MKEKILIENIRLLQIRGKILIENICMLAIVRGNSQRFKKTFAEILVCCKNALVGNSRFFTKRFKSFIGLFGA